jgi:chromosome segregation and condensation protein ScpB
MEEKKPTVINTETNTLKNIKTLMVISVLEPITKKELKQSLGKSINGNHINLVLKELIEDGFILKEKEWYRTTYKGSSFKISREVKKLRDIQRMKHLFKLYKRRGGNSVGR